MWSVVSIRDLEGRNYCNGVLWASSYPFRRPGLGMDYRSAFGGRRASMKEGKEGCDRRWNGCRLVRDWEVWPLNSWGWKKSMPCSKVVQM